MTEHLPRHLYQFGRYLRICYESQPNFITITNDNNNSQDTLPLEKQPTPQQQLQQDTHSQQTSEDEHQTSEDRAYSRNLVQHSILARKGTFLLKRALFFKKKAPKFHPPPFHSIPF